MIVRKGSFSIGSWPIVRGTTFVLVVQAVVRGFTPTNNRHGTCLKGPLEKENIYELPTFRCHVSFWEGVSFVTHNFV